MERDGYGSWMPKSASRFRSRQISETKAGMSSRARAMNSLSSSLPKHSSASDSVGLPPFVESMNFSTQYGSPPTLAAGKTTFSLRNRRPSGVKDSTGLLVCSPPASDVFLSPVCLPARQYHGPGVARSARCSISSSSLSVICEGRVMQAAAPHRAEKRSGGSLGRTG